MRGKIIFVFINMAYIFFSSQLLKLSMDNYLCVCAHTQVGSGTCHVHLCVPIEARGQPSGSFLRGHPFYFLRQSLGLTVCRLHLLASEPENSFCSPFPYDGFSARTNLAWLLCGFQLSPQHFNGCVCVCVYV